MNHVWDRRELMQYIYDLYTLHICLTLYEEAGLEFVIEDGHITKIK